MRNCPVCGRETKVTDSRPDEKSNVIRHRECLNCKRRFVTKETLLREVNRRDK